MKNMMLIVNPMSGRGRSSAALGDLISIFGTADYAVTVFMTTPERGADYYARNHSDKFEIIVCIGGDGTLSNLANGLMLVPSPPPVGFIPMGTANDVARTLCLPSDINKAAEIILTGTPKAIDVGSYNENYFMYIAAFGAFTEVSYTTPQKTKRALGHLAYILEGLSSMPNIRPVHAAVEYDLGFFKDEFIFGAVTNSTSVAGLLKLDSQDVSLSDGLFELILIRPPESIRETGDIITDILTQKFQHKKVLFMHSREIKFEFDDETAWTRDGEDGGSHKSISVVNHKKALRIIL
jgi:diacylglycerol kinase (ATP)